jgi:hypothetical protein
MGNNDAEDNSKLSDEDERKKAAVMEHEHVKNKNTL